jgi:formylglycine-generating enzyme required for sulfatase activity
MKPTRLLFLLIPLSLTGAVKAQSLQLNTSDGMRAGIFTDTNTQAYQVDEEVPFFSLIVNGNLLSSIQADAHSDQDKYFFNFGDALQGEVIPQNGFSPGWKAIIKITNNTGDTIDIENVVPFGQSADHLYITSTGPWALARAKLFRQGYGPVGVILPDNAWELGFAEVAVGGDISLCALTRRSAIDKGEYRRYRTIVYPGGTLEYAFYTDSFKGDWQTGLALLFHDRYLYDLKEFDNTLFEREDLEWIRKSYVVGLQFAWNKEFYDWKNQQYHYFRFLDQGQYYFGGYDVFGLWPTWPRLGVDQRNQWDLFSDMPGGLEQLKFFSQQGKRAGTKFFICYNPWDESTRAENPYTGMASLIDATDADGVVLDCHGASSFALQHAADSIKKGVVMYSEGMAVTADMPGIVAGRVHDAIYLPPPLNLNKVIKPEFAIFRVCQIHDGRIRREASIAFFNGYGTELNTFAPGQFENMFDDLVYLGRTTMTLRENSGNFLSDHWTPLLPTLRDSIWVNRWQTGDKTIFTILSLVPEGFKGPLFQQEVPFGYHLVSLWHHEELNQDSLEGQSFIPVRVEAFNRFDLDSRAEGNVDCIAILPVILTAGLENNRVELSCNLGDEIRIWAGMPSYQNTAFVKIRPGTHSFDINELFGNYEGKVVVQVLSDRELLDERILFLKPGKPRLIANPPDKYDYNKAPEGMVKIPTATFIFSAENTHQFIPYPDVKDQQLEMNEFYIDKYPVTNRQFHDFIKATDYHPEDDRNFLKHWNGSEVPNGLENHPVVYVSLEDAQAYAQWTGKRLPTEAEWQYSGQGTDGRSWPWGKEFDSTRCNNASGGTLPVDRFQKGKSPFGVMDMTGNVWQFTSDVYDNGTYFYVILKGGSFYKPGSSWWYVKGGPQPLNWHQQLLLVSPGFDRNSTVGFRCAADVKE